MTKRRSKNPELRAFGAYLQALRGERSREQISLKLKELGVPLGGSTLLQYEKGTVWAPDPGVLWGLARIYKRPLDELVLLLRENRAHPNATDTAAGDLIRQSAEYRSTPSNGGADVAAAEESRTKYAERLERVEDFLAQALEDVRSGLTELNDQGGEERRRRG